MTEDRRASEVERRELARRHQGEVIPDSGRPLEPRSIPVMVSVRLEAGLVADLRSIARERGVTMSELLREGARLIVSVTRTASILIKLKWEVVPLAQNGASSALVRTFSGSPKA